MRQGQKIDLGMNGYDELFMTDEQRRENKLPNMMCCLDAQRMCNAAQFEKISLSDLTFLTIFLQLTSERENKAHGRKDVIMQNVCMGSEKGSEKCKN